MNTTPRLQRSRSDTMIAGVSAGIANYLGIDPVLSRLVFVLLLFSGPGLFVYLLLWLIMPQEPANQAPGQVFVAAGTPTERLKVYPMTGQNPDPEQEIPIQNLGEKRAQATPAGRNSVLGWILLGLGGFLVLQMIWPGFGAVLFPALLIGAGVYLLRRA
ncbi:MAG: PspC domain-containing protein [Oscillochloris sp.]|nr:PspC domain-containing protein [Oscillochloris sp.]